MYSASLNNDLFDKGLNCNDVTNIKDIKSLEETVDTLINAIEERNEFLIKNRILSINDYKGDDLPYIILYIDQLNKEFKNIIDKLSQLLRKSRSLGIYILIGNDLNSNEMLPGSISINVVTRISFKTSSEMKSNIIVNSDEAYKLKEDELLIKYFDDAITLNFK